jgi:hypothetical protein
VPLATLQAAFGREGRVNVVLARGARRGALAETLARAVTPADLGLRLRELEPGRRLALESDDAMLDDAVVEAARGAASEAGLAASASLVYLANELRVRDAAVPYSLVAAVDEGSSGGRLRPLCSAAAGAASSDVTPIVLNDWTARELWARAGDEVTLEYYLWHEQGSLETRRATFRVASVVPIAGAAADRELVPDYPGITREARLADWDPPFAVDLSRIRPQDEAYWQRHHTTPKAWIPLAAGRALWGHRLGGTTSLRLSPRAGAEAAAPPSDPARAFGQALMARVAPAARGLVVEDVRARALAAARGATDFGQYFVYFSFFLVVAALLLAGLFFRFGLEQRLAELGLLRAVGFTERQLRGLFLAEGAVLGGAGAVLGALGAIGYAALMMLGLRTVWVGAVGTRSLALSVGPLELALGALGGLAAIVVAIVAALRGLRGRSVRSLLARAPQEWGAPPRGRRLLRVAMAAALLLGAGIRELLTPRLPFSAAGRRSSLPVLRLRPSSGERQRAAAAVPASVAALASAGGLPPRAQRVAARSSPSRRS